MPRLVKKAYLVDGHPLNPQIRRVLTDGLSVFIPGWGNTSEGYIRENYKLVVFPGEVEMFQSFKIAWYEKSAWSDEAWAWCYMNEHSEFVATTTIGGIRYAV